MDINQNKQCGNENVERGDGQGSGMRVAYGLFFFIEPENIDNVQVYIFQLSKRGVFKTSRFLEPYPLTPTHLKLVS